MLHTMRHELMKSIALTMKLILYLQFWFKFIIRNIHFCRNKKYLPRFY